MPADRGASLGQRAKVVLFANTDWYLYNFRRSLALALQAEGYDVLLLSPPGPYGAKLTALGLRWQAVPMDRRSLNPLREAALLVHLVRVLAREQPALVHGFTIKCAVYGSLAARLAGVPARVNAVAGMGYVFTSDDLKARLLRWPVRTLLRLALGGPGARLVLQNPDDVAMFEQARLVASDQVRLIPGSGVDLQRFVPAIRAREPGSPMTVLLAARLLWDKGLAEYVEAIRQLRAQGRPLRFLIAGTPDPGNPAAVPEETVRSWESEGLLEWLGHVDDMPGLLASVDAVVLPSYREGLPKTLIEAAACALPLVTNDVPGCREVVTHGVDGLLVPAREAPALAAAIARLQDGPELAARLGEAARVKALARFDERVVIAGTLAVYRELLDQPPARRLNLRQVAVAAAVALIAVGAVLPSAGMKWLRREFQAFSVMLSRIERLFEGVDSTHVLMFAGASFLLAFALPRTRIGRMVLTGLALILAVAVLSELVQFFVPGRTPKLTDVRDDLVGGLVGLVVGLGLRLVFMRWWRNPRAPIG